MSNVCAACGEPFGPNDFVQPLPPVIQLRVGDKSGQLGWYVEGNPETEHVHVECVNVYYQVEDTPMWNEIEHNVRESIREDERAEIREEAMREMAEANGLICKECLEEVEPEDAVVVRPSYPPLPPP